MSTELDLDDLKKMRQELFNTIEFVKNEAGNARDNGKINDTQFLDAQVEWGKLETQESTLQGLIMALQLDFLLDTNVDSPRSQIIQATNRLEQAARRIELFGNFLLEIAKVIDNYFYAVQSHAES
jgi:hypothetical protein